MFLHAFGQDFKQPWAEFLCLRAGPSGKILRAFGQDFNGLRATVYAFGLRFMPLGRAFGQRSNLLCAMWRRHLLEAYKGQEYEPDDYNRFDPLEAIPHKVREVEHKLFISSFLLVRIR
ncbi:hypothetical protein QVD17_00443 [Tagetes erecta]|uniref:Uncharacterized protein n=1 Tax=Tagetes erecta TaxID=13708 RepID=A0AAD8L5T1_TARER|nr:hypothetical protein QVD17_00443 [Tagetes erecta]